MSLNAREAARILEAVVQQRLALTTFADCNRWHAQRARLEQEIALSQGDLSQQEHALAHRVRTDWVRLRQRSLLDRLLGASYFLWVVLVCTLQKFVAWTHRRALEQVLADVVASGALVPRSGTERDDYLGRLQHRRADLALQKRELASSKRGIRQSSRGARAMMMGSRAGFARFARASVALSAHGALSKIEERHERLEADAILVEREVMWLRRLR